MAGPTVPISRRLIFCVIELGADDLSINWSNFLNHPIMLIKGSGVRLEMLLDAVVFTPWHAYRGSRRPKDVGLGFRYRRRPSSFPDVRLSFSKSGVSTTIGAYGAGGILGSKGDGLGASPPESGLSFTARMPAKNSWENSWGNFRRSVSKDPAPGSGLEVGAQEPPPAAGFPSLLADKGAIAGGGLAAMTSEGLGELEELINEAARRRQELRNRIGRARSKLRLQELRLTLARSPILALLLSWTVDGLRRSIANARAEVDTASRELELGIINLVFDLDKSAEAAYAQLKISFDHLARSNRIWDAASNSFADHADEMKTATSLLPRNPVRVGRTTSAIINSPQDALRFDNANGAPLLIYPGVVMTQKDSGDFALADIRQLDLRSTGIGCVEEEGLPPDAQIIGKTWKWVNKDGSPDRRFRNNYQVPIAQYGSIEFSSQAGIRGVYHFSNAEMAALFAADFEAFKESLSAGAKSPVNARISDAETAAALKAPAAEPIAAQAWPEIRKKPTGLRMIVDMSVVLACVALSIHFGLWSTSQQVAAGKPRAPGGADRTVAASVDKELVEPLQSGAVAGAPAPDKVSSTVPGAVAPEYTAKVKLKRANVRAYPNKTAAIVATLKKGKTVMLLEQQGDWYRVRWGHDMGWMHKTTINVRDIPNLPAPE